MEQKIGFWERLRYYFLGFITGPSEACEAKIYHDSFTVAKAAAKKIFEKYGFNRYPYLCVWCRGYHLTRNGKWDL